MRPTDKALVRNAADPDQVAQAKRKEKFTRDDELNDIRAVFGLENEAGYQARHFLWRLLGACGVNRSIMVTSAEIYYRAGQQDVGHRVMADVLEADPEIYLLAQAEAITRDRNAVEPERKDPE